MAYYFSTPIAYIAIALYLLVISLMLWVIPGEWNIIDSGYAQLDGLMQLSPWLLLLLCPALTMHQLAEERESGTWEVVLSKPISLGRIIVAKYMASWTIVMIAQLPCLVHMIALSQIVEPAGNIDYGATICGFIGLALTGAVLTAVGIWASSVSKSQIIAFLVGFICGFCLFYGFDLLSMLLASTPAANSISLLGINHHLGSISRGVIDLRDLVYFVTLSASFVLLTMLSMKKKMTL